MPLQQVGGAINDFMSAGSDFLNNHPILAAGLMFGMNPGADEMAEPALEDEGSAIASKVEESVSVYMKTTTDYVGITNNMTARSSAHGEQLDEIAKGLTRTQARGLEQAVIEQQGLAKNGGTLTNKINSISPRNPIYQQAVEFGRVLLQSLGLQ